MHGTMNVKKKKEVMCLIFIKINNAVMCALCTEKY